MISIESERRFLGVVTVTVGRIKWENSKEAQKLFEEVIASPCAPDLGEDMSALSEALGKYKEVASQRRYVLEQEVRVFGHRVLTRTVRSPSL